MRVLADPSVWPLLREAQRLLGGTQASLAQSIGLSRRTVSRWAGSGSPPATRYIERIVAAVHPKDRGLAANIASHIGNTLAGLGLEASAPPALGEAPAVRPMPPVPLLAESIVCAAADALETSPGAVRHALRAAFARAKALGLSVAEVDAALALKPEPTAAKAPGKSAKSAPSPA